MTALRYLAAWMAFLCVFVLVGNLVELALMGLGT